MSMACVREKSARRSSPSRLEIRTHLRPQLVNCTLIRANLFEPQHQLGKRASEDRSGVEVAAEDQSAQWRLGGGLDDLEVGLLGRGEDGLGGVGTVGEDAGRGRAGGSGLGDEGVGFGFGGLGFGGVE